MLHVLGYEPKEGNISLAVYGTQVLLAQERKGKTTQATRPHAWKASGDCLTELPSCAEEIMCTPGAYRGAGESSCCPRRTSRLS
eukprot:969716-Pelagomonas_calceolata.AAC.8